jgi:uncharacterized protein
MVDAGFSILEVSAFSFQFSVFSFQLSGYPRPKKGLLLKSWYNKIQSLMETRVVRKRLCFHALPLALVFGCGWMHTAAAVAPEKKTAPPNHPVKLARCCVWRITNTKAPVYLIGSVHALNAHDYPLPAAYDLALNDCRQFLFEFDPDKGDEFSKKFKVAGQYPSGVDIRQKINPQLLQWLRQNIDTIHLEYSSKDKKYHARRAGFDSALQYKPWWIAFHYFDVRGFADVTFKHGVDNYLAGRAKKAGKQVGGLETVDEHVDVLAGLSDQDSEILLVDELSHGFEDEKHFNELRADWRRGDTRSLWLFDERLRRRAPRIAARIADDRNVRWIPRIEHEIQSGKPTAIVAGALHFSGPNSVVKLLEQRGYVIEQL